MKINLIELEKALKCVNRYPNDRNDVLKVPLFDRCNSLSFPAWTGSEVADITYKELILTSERYCTSPDNCWYEWELNIQE